METQRAKPPSGGEQSAPDELETSRATDRSALLYASISVAVISMTALLMPAAAPHFQRFFGPVSPVLVAASAAALGAAALGFLRIRAGFAIVRGHETLRGLSRAAGLATLLAIAIIIADVFIRYPADLNVPLPAALLFYPAVGFVAEMVFHVVPLAVLLLLLAPLGRRWGQPRIVWLCIGLVAAAEPTYQITLHGEPLSAESAYTWVHVAGIASSQLCLFWRYDFVTMYGFRLVYYAYWHIVWGTVRLQVLF